MVSLDQFLFILERRFEIRIPLRPINQIALHAQLPVCVEESPHTCVSDICQMEMSGAMTLETLAHYLLLTVLISTQQFMLPAIIRNPFPAIIAKSVSRWLARANSTLLEYWQVIPIVGHGLFFPEKRHQRRDTRSADCDTLQPETIRGRRRSSKFVTGVCNDTNRCALIGCEIVKL